MQSWITNAFIMPVSKRKKYEIQLLKFPHILIYLNIVFSEHDNSYHNKCTITY